MKKLGLVVVLTLMILTGCKRTVQTQPPTKPIQRVINERVQVSEENPIAVDKENKSVLLYARVNGNFFNEKTRHAITFQDGKYGDKSMFVTYVDPITVYEKLEELGAKPGNNVTLDNADTVQTEGTRLEWSLLWDDNAIPVDINELIQDSNGGKIDLRFGGNKELAEERQNGCIACFDSCPVGITSNHTYSYGAVMNETVTYTVQQDKMPKDGSYVTIILRLIEKDTEKETGEEKEETNASEPTDD